MIYFWLRKNYENLIQKQLEEAIDWGEMSQEEAEVIFERMMEEWEANYGDNFYDLKGDR